MAVLGRRHNGERTHHRARSVQRYQPLRDLEEIQEQTAQLLEQMMGVPADVARAWVPDVEQTRPRQIETREEEPESGAA